MNFEKWIEKFMTGWKERDFDAVVKTSAKDCQYFENVFGPPCKSFEDIRKLWEVVPEDQKDITFKYEILAENNELCLVNFFEENSCSLWSDSKDRWYISVR